MGLQVRMLLSGATQPTGISAGLDRGGDLGGEAWLKLLFLRTRYEEGLIYKGLKGEWGLVTYHPFPLFLRETAWY